MSTQKSLMAVLKTLSLSITLTIFYTSSLVQAADVNRSITGSSNTGQPKTEAERQAEFKTWMNKAAPIIEERSQLINQILNNTKTTKDPSKSTELAQALHNLSLGILKSIADEDINDLIQLETRINKARRSTSRAAPKYALGDTVNMVFTPINPCRIADSRSASLGKLNANTTRPYYNYAAPGQGGVGNCNNFGSPGMYSGTSGALALTVTVTQPESGGWLLLSPYNQSTSASVINFAAGDTIANSTVVQTAGIGSGYYDIQIHTVARTHVILDLLGFYLPSEPAALDCYETSEVVSASHSTAYSEVTAYAPACATGYTRVAMNCTELDSLFVADLSVSDGYCSFDGPYASGYGYASAQCCRVPGSTGSRF